MTSDQTISIANIQINQKIIGEGKPLLMLHGWGSNINLLQPLADKLVPLGYKIYMLDLPGFGDSADPPEPYTVFDYANFCIQYMDYHKLKTVDLFGHSFGGRLGLILGSENADRIHKMVLSDSAGIKTEAPLHAKLKLKTYQSIRDGLYSIGAKSLADNLRESYNKRYGSTDFQQVSGVMRQTFINVVNQDLLDYAKRVKVSTILIWGDKDDDTPLAHGKQLEQAIPDAALIVHEGAGHYAYLDFPDKTARIMDALFKNS